MTSTTPPPTNPVASNDSEIAVPLTPEDNLPNGVSVPTCQVPRNDPSRQVRQADPLTAQIDLHQIGGGFLGHFYFTHTYDGTLANTSTTFNSLGTASSVVETTQVPAGVEHRVTGAWTPAIPRGSAAAIYDIQVALPDHGANATGVTYVVDPGGTTYTGGTSLTCTVNQNIAPGQNTWLDLGDYSLKPGADLTLDNMVPGATGSLDVAVSAAVFIPDPGQTRRPCSGGTAEAR